MLPTFPLLLTFILLLLAVAWLNQRIYHQTVILVYQLTASTEYTFTFYFVLMLPGIFVHEASHWVAAKVLGLRPGKFQIWPRKRGKKLRLGSVTARSGGIWLDSVVGIAPLVIGSLLIALIGQSVFAAGQVTNALVAGRLGETLTALRNAFRSTDGPLWAYFLFTLANGMMPSAPDREPIKPVLLYSALAVLIYLLLGMPLDPLAELFNSLRQPLQSVTSALLLTILVDLVVLFLLAVVSALVPRRM